MIVSRRELVASGAFAVAAGPAILSSAVAKTKAIEQWGIFEASYRGRIAGNPFVDVDFGATFTLGDRAIEVPGFYDGQGIYRVRFMPPFMGAWAYRTRSNARELNGKRGAFTATAPRPGNHGPVRVQDKYRFAYADGTPYRQVGTTCYAWTCQTDALQDRTLKTLASSPFNKMRMGVFPKWFNYNHVEPPSYPFEGQAPAKWDFTRFNPAYFQNLEHRIGQLGAMGIEADLILFHPYDEGHWGFDRMGAENDDRYVRYVIARLAAYRNVWWSLANEWDFFKTMTAADFERIGQLVAKTDPFAHLCSIHNQRTFFDHNRPWVTHLSVQNDNPENAQTYIAQYGKPVVFDEARYEGNISQGWGDISAERMVAMFWKTHIQGAFCGHGETYLNDREELWWSKGGELVGQSPARIAFFKQVIDGAPPEAAPLAHRNTWGVEGKYYLTYLWDRQHASQGYRLPADGQFRADILDTLAMTATPVPGAFSGVATIPLPSKPYLAIRVVRI
ncbi:DUF5060 domain-containing protein [Sphingomonas sp.]|jgi:hypothetical protein|uniref:DUF5060 domain-containing protein n=1 Tax=Sphingomonas sp. TaxID=28214 RepID=UPI002EDA7C5A